MSRSIEIAVDTAGEITIDAVGFKGPDCTQATAFLEETLGTVQDRKHKPEYHARSVSARRQQPVGQ